CTCWTWRREDGWPGSSLRLALGFNLADQHGRSDRAHRNAAGFGSADPVEDVLLVVRGNDAIQRALWRSHNADAANELVGAAVDVDPVDHQRDHLKGLRGAARRDGESRRDVLKVEAVGFALFFRFGFQHLAEFGVTDRFGGGHDEVALPARRPVA